MTAPGTSLVSTVAAALLSCTLGACATDSASAECPDIPLYDNRTTSLHEALDDAHLLDQQKVTDYAAEASADDRSLSEGEARAIGERKAACEYVGAYAVPFTAGSGCVELPPGYCP